MSDDGPQNPNQAQDMLVRFMRQLAERGGGELDDLKLADSLATLFEFHRQHGSPIDDLIALGAATYVEPHGESVAVFLGFRDDDVRARVRGRRIRLGSL